MSGRAPKLYLVAYDICDPKRWRKVYALIRGHGERLQYSVFRCVLSELALATLEDALLEVIDLEEDQVILIPLGVAEKPRSWRMTTLGKSTPPPERTVTVV